MFKLILTLVFLYILIITMISLFQERLIFPGTKIDLSHEYTFEGEYDEFNVATSDNQNLNGVLFRCEQPSQKLVIYFHGNRGDLDKYGPYAIDFIDRGYDVAFYDFRGYGKSTGKTNGKHIISDGQFIVEHFLKKYKSENIIFYGRSLGSGVAVQLAKVFDIRKVLLEAPYANFNEVVRKALILVPRFLLKRFDLNSEEAIKIKSLQ